VKTWEGINVVLVEPQGPINVGMIARTMKNFGFKKLTLVNPKCPPLHPWSLVMAKGAKEVLWEARVFESLKEALKESSLVVGTTGKRRRGIELVPIREAVGEILQVSETQKVSILFGREDSGLTNEELSLCHLNVFIPTDESHPSLNLSQAVAVILYELSTYGKNFEPLPKKLAPWEELMGLFEHLEQTLEAINFPDPKRALGDLKEIIFRAKLDPREVRLLRGILRQIGWRIKHEGTGFEDQKN
jgi:TrmH family RNA methyltransferase